MAIMRHIVCLDTLDANPPQHFGPDFPPYQNCICSHKSGCGIPTDAQAEHAGTFSIRSLFCKRKQNIK